MYGRNQRQNKVAFVNKNIFVHNVRSIKCIYIQGYFFSVVYRYKDIFSNVFLIGCSIIINARILRSCLCAIRTFSLKLDFEPLSVSAI